MDKDEVIKRIKKNKNDEEALQKLKAYITANDPDMLYTAGFMHLFGSYLDKNFDLAFQYFNQAAILNNAKAMRMLAHCYKKGKGTNVNEELAFYWLLNAAYKGDSIAMQFVAEEYMLGKYVVRNEDYARHWFQKGAAAGNDSCLRVLIKNEWIDKNED